MARTPHAYVLQEPGTLPIRLRQSIGRGALQIAVGLAGVALITTFFYVGSSDVGTLRCRRDDKRCEIRHTSPFESNADVRISDLNEAQLWHKERSVDHYVKLLTTGGPIELSRFALSEADARRVVERIEGFLPDGEARALELEWRPAKQTFQVVLVVSAALSLFIVALGIASVGRFRFEVDEATRTLNMRHMKISQGARESMLVDSIVEVGVVGIAPGSPYFNVELRDAGGAAKRPPGLFLTREEAERVATILRTLPRSAIPWGDRIGLGLE